MKPKTQDVMAAALGEATYSSRVATRMAEREVSSAPVHFRRDGTVSVNGMPVGTWMNLGTVFRFETDSGKVFDSKTQAGLRPYALQTRLVMGEG